MPTPPTPPDGWDFGPEFLADPEHLPPFVAAHDSPLFGSSRRPTGVDLAHRLPLSDSAPTADERRPHTVVLDAVRAVVEVRTRQRHGLHGPARLVLPEELLNRHLLWVGPPGVGKTSQGVLPTVQALLGDVGRSLVVFDPKGDQSGMIKDLARAAGRSGRSVLRLNLTDPLGSLGWNPLRRGMSRTTALGIASTLVLASENKDSRDSPFWRNTSIELIVDVLLGLDGDPDEVLTLPRVLEIVSMPRNELMDWLRRHGVHKFAAYLGSGSHNAETCLTDTGMRLMSLLDLDLCAVLSHGELQLERLFSRPTVLIVEMNETRLEPLRPIFNLLVQQILDRAIEAAERHPDSRLRVPLSLVIDEFASAIGAIPRFPVYLNTLRSRRVSVIAAVQGLSQIRALYGTDAGAVLLGFSSKVFFPGVDHDDAEFASRSSGTMTVAAPMTGEQGMVFSRRVFLPEEVARPRAHPVLGQPVTMVLAETPPCQVYLTPSFRLPQFRQVLTAEARRRRRPRRRHPLRYEPRRPGVGMPRLTDIERLSPQQILMQLRQAELHIELHRAPAEAQAFWLEWRASGHGQLALMLRIAEQLWRRGLSVADYFTAHGESRCDNPQVTLLYLYYLIARRAHEQKRRDAS